MSLQSMSRAVRQTSMRNLLLIAPILYVLLSFSLDTRAQSHYESAIYLGVKGGADLSRVMFNPNVHQGFKLGGVGGITFRYIEERHFGLIAEVLWQQRGWKENFEELPFSYERTLDYIQIPVMAHVYFGRRGRFFFNAGPELGIFLGESTKSNFDPERMSSIPDFPNTNRTNSQMTMSVTQKVDYGISAGLGGEFFINPRNSLQLEARFYFGLGNIFPSARADIFSASNSMSLMFTAGYWFKIK